MILATIFVGLAMLIVGVINVYAICSIGRGEDELRD